MIEKFKNSKAFTLIELIVVVGVIGILVLIASSSFSKQTEKAKHNAALADMKIVADATDMYNIDNNDWPRLTDEHYTSDELKTYSENFYDATGKKAKIDTKGKYYDIDYDKLSQYAKAPVNKENYILQNPAGKVFYMENLTAEGKDRVDYGTNKEPEEPALYEFTSHTFTNAGQTGRTGPTKSMLDNAYKNSQVEGHVTSDNGIQLWTVPKSGTYRIETYGSSGYNKYSYGRGSKMAGDFELAIGSELKILAGQMGTSGSGGTTGGGGGTFVTLDSNTPLIISGGGGGNYNRTSSRYRSDASLSTSGLGSNNGYNGGSNGNGGKGNNSNGASGGGGMLTNGTNGTYGTFGNSFITGGLGGSANNGASGGFGGGGGSHGSTGGGGGGGGYSGGAGGYHNESYGNGGGGGSFNSGTNQENSVGNTGHGKVVITYIGE